MNEVSVAEQQQIFDAARDDQEREAIDALIGRHRTNVALTQQLALDASRLVTTGQERLARQSEAGFVKRLVSAISGKTSENQLLNQADMLQMQRFAWHYLQQLQQQNLINAQSIAVIRNNLGTMNEYIIETRDFLELAIDKIDQRLRHVENNTSLSGWALNVEAHKRRFKSIPRNLLILRLTYDFMRKNPQVALTERDVGNYLVTTLEKLDVNCDEQVKLLDFVSALIDEIDVVGIDQYRAAIELSFDAHTLDSDYVQKNISGIGLNALHFLSDQYETIAALVGDDEVCTSDAARERIISSLFGKELAGLSAIYSIRDLICEIVGGSQLAIELYKEEHRLNVVEDEPVVEPNPEIVALLSSLPDLHAHTFLDSGVSDASKRDYLLLLALCVESSAPLSGLAREFIALLTEKAGLADLQREIAELADSPRKYQQSQATIEALLNSEDRKYTWLLDAFFLLTLAQKPIESAQIKMLLGMLKPAQLKECLPNLLLLVSGNDESQLLDATIKLAGQTQGWKNVVRYRELRFDTCFAEPVKRLKSADWAIIELMSDMTHVYSKGMEHAYYFGPSGDGGLLSSVADKAAASLCSMGRSSALSALNEYRKKALDAVSEGRWALAQANSVIARWNLPAFEFKDEVGHAEFDLDNSADNEDWGDQFQRYHRRIDGTLNGLSRACRDAAEQLGFFASGDFERSVLAIREQQRAQRLREQMLEKLQKQSVTIMKDGREHLFSIEWQQVENPPCDPDQITHIKTDGKIWLVVASIASNDVFYRSEDGVNWRQVQLDAPHIKISLDSIDIVNGMWIVRNRSLREGTRDEGCYYSKDALDWQHASAPEASKNKGRSLDGGLLSYKNILYFNDTWLWCATRYRQYSYTEKGLFSNSTKTDIYAQTLVFCSKDLGGPWQHWDQAPQPGDGVKIETICALPGKNALLAFCEYDWSYMQKKKLDKAPFVMYYGAAKSWQVCDWGGSTDFRPSGAAPVHSGPDGTLVYIGSEVLTSEKGYEWNLQATTRSIDRCFPLKELGLFTSRDLGSGILVSQDAKLFKELELEQGVWTHIAANEGGTLGVYYANKHEETVLRVGRYICQARP